VSALFTPRAFLVGAVAKVALVVLALLFGPACSTSQLSSHVTAARLTRPALDGVAQGLEVACSTERAAELGRAGDDEGYAQLRRRCARGAESHEVARQAWLGYLDAVLAAVSGGSVDIADLISWGLRVAQAYQAVAGLLTELGRDAPPLPSQLARLAGGDR